MLRSVYTASALIAALVVTLPFIGEGSATVSTAMAAGVNSTAPVITASGVRTSPLDAATTVAANVNGRPAVPARSAAASSSPSTSLSSASKKVSARQGKARATAGTSSTPSTPPTSASAAPAAPAPAAPAAPAPAAPAPAPVAPAPAAPPPAPACASAVGGSAPGAPSRVSAGGVAGTSSADLQGFASAYNAIRVANCLPPVPMANFRYDSCMEDRLFWMAEDPSLDPMSAWGHIGSQRSDGVPSVGCDGNLAGGSGNSGASVAQKWWDSSGHRASLYKPTFTGSTAGVCIRFAMTHGGLPAEPIEFTRAAARWGNC